MDKNIHFIKLTGDKILPHITLLAQLRLQVFYEYPYLYEGELASEEQYLKKFTISPNGIMILALDKEETVGASTAIPLAEEVEATKTPFLETSYDVNQIFYFSESVLLPKYRKQGIGARFFKEREAVAREYRKYKHIAFCAVERSESDPRKPVDYKSPCSLWQKQGFIKHPELTTQYTWKEIGDTKESPKTMTFWIKPL